MLVHGTVGDYRTWAQQIEPLSQSFRVISYSRRYHYPNQWPSAASSFSAHVHADDLAALIEELDLGAVHLVGHSFGAFAALLAARDRPELFRSLTLGEPPAAPLLAESPEGLAILEGFNPFAGVAEAIERGEERQGVRHFIDGVLGAGAYDGLPADLQDQMLQNARQLAGEAREPSPFPPFSCDDARSIKLPTLLVSGENSPGLFRLIQDTLADCLPNAKTAVLPEASHGLQYENAPAFNSAVLGFLASL